MDFNESKENQICDRPEKSLKGIKQGIITFTSSMKLQIFPIDSVDFP